MSDRAVISLQLGHYSNFVGAHFWNLQESSFVYGGGSGDARPKSEICHDVLYREGQTLSREVTYTPRLVCVDLKGSLGGLPEFGDLYFDARGLPQSSTFGKDPSSQLWAGEVVVQKEEPRRRNDFQKEMDSWENINVDEDKDICESQEDAGGSSPRKKGGSDEGPGLQSRKLYDLDEQVDVWSDYLMSRFHPKTNVILGEFQHKHQLKPFDTFGLGSEAWKEGEGDEIEDRLRFFAEDADNVQGFHILSDNYNAFGGLTGSLFSLLADDYPTKSIASFPLSPAAFADFSPGANSSRFLNTLLSLGAQCSPGLANANSTLVSPLSLARDTFVLPGQQSLSLGASVNYAPERDYHTSAVLAAALDTVSMPWRSLNRSDGSLYEICSGLGLSGRRVAALSTVLPLALEKNQFVVDMLSRSERMNLVSLLPGCQQAETDVHLQAVTVRGWNSSQLRPRDFQSSQKYANHKYLKSSDSLDSAVGHFFREKFPRTSTVVSAFETRLNVGKPFPHIFDKSVDSQGFVSSSAPRNPETTGVDSLSALTCLQSSKGAGEHINTLVQRGKKIGIRKFHKFIEAGLEEEEFKEILENLESVADCYREDSSMM